MDLHSAFPYWLLRHGLIKSYPSLTKDTVTDIVVLGGGLSGAFTAWYLQEAGYSVLLADRRHIGTGSTAANTGLLQYETDTSLVQLAGLIGWKHAERCYRLCLESIHELKAICARIGASSLFSATPSFQYASFQTHAAGLNEEYLARKKAGIRVEWMDSKAIQSHFGFRKSAGILSAEGAVIDPYALTHALLAAAVKKGLQVYDHTEVVSIRGTGPFTLATGQGSSIKSRKLIIACGYESQHLLPFGIQTLQTTFAIASEPLPTADPWYRNCMIWETAIPYLYLRVTDDQRVLIGGKDVTSSSPQYRNAVLKKKAEALRQAFTRLFPHIPFQTDFYWGGHFGVTRDGLPCIGTLPHQPHTYYTLGLGGNGTVFSLIGARAIRDALVTGRRPEAFRLFKFGR